MRVRIRVRIGFSVWLVSGYAHVFGLLSIVIVTLPMGCTSAVCDMDSAAAAATCGAIQE